jgi:hypothetical protein
MNIEPEQEEKEEEVKKEEDQDQEIDALSNNKVGVKIEPNVLSNKVLIQLCSCSILVNCFTKKDE